MPTLDPIVNTEPKEKVVQTFNEDDIVKIVNDGIARKQIDVGEPSGGTQLYLHDLNFGDSAEGPATETISVLMVRSSPIENEGQLQSNLQKIISYYVTNAHGRGIYLFLDGSTWKLKQQDSYYDDTYSATLGVFINDVITEL